MLEIACCLHILFASLLDFPTCLLCTCISTTVYCDDHELDAIPPLPKNTAYFYSRFNRIKKINKNDFASLSMDAGTNILPFYFLNVCIIKCWYQKWNLNIKMSCKSIFTYLYAWRFVLITIRKNDESLKVVMKLYGFPKWH